MATERTPEEMRYASSVYGNSFAAPEPETLDDDEEDYDSESCDCDGWMCGGEDELVDCSDCRGSGECPTCGGEGTL